MRCIFCKKDSSTCVSIEHVIPESLGNKNTVLPKGTVCDSCNNYFASNIEKPILDSEEFTRLRFNQLIKNKKGRIPEAEIIFGQSIVKARRNGESDFSFNSEDYDKIEKYLASSNSGEMMIPITGKPPSDKYLPRFLAKMGLEALAHRWLQIENWNDYIVEHKQLDPIRDYARRPKSGETWKYSKRRIYGEDNMAKEIDGVGYQIMNEWDILITGNIDNSEFYFVVAIFGVEYAINLGGNSMNGYEAWLKNHDNKSPLYTGKNFT